MQCHNDAMEKIDGAKRHVARLVHNQHIAVSMKTEFVLDYPP